MVFGEAIGTCFSKYPSFSGRAPRSEYWYFWRPEARTISSRPFVCQPRQDIIDKLRGFNRSDITIKTA